VPHIDGAVGWVGAGAGAAVGAGAASAGVTTRSVGTGVAAGADASFNEVEDASVVGAGIWTDWKYRVDVGAVVAESAAGVGGVVGVGGVLAWPWVAPPHVVAVGPNEAA